MRVLRKREWPQMSVNFRKWMNNELLVIGYR